MPISFSKLKIHYSVLHNFISNFTYKTDTLWRRNTIMGKPLGLLQQLGALPRKVSTQRMAHAHGPATLHKPPTGFHLFRGLNFAVLKTIAKMFTATIYTVNK